MNLFEYFLTQAGRPMIKNAHYFPIYERYFARFVGSPVLVFEIGTGAGGSAQMWKRYFGPMAQIVTIDIEDKSILSESQIYPRQGNQSDCNFLLDLVSEFGRPDIVIDDGSHRMEDVCKTFEVLYPAMSQKGVFLIEDMNASYYPEYGGGLHKQETIIERCKQMIDEINARHTGGSLIETVAGRETFSICFFDMVIVLEKAPYINKEMLTRP